MVGHAVDRWGRLDVLVNNAARFYSTPVASATNAQWEDLIGSNLKAPFFLAQATAPFLAKVGGTIINIIDIHGSRPKLRHPIYCVSKAGLSMLTQSLAQELGPDVRVNGVSPGAILWPEQELAPTLRDEILDRLILKHLGRPQDIAQSVLFLIRDSHYITGQIITVDGGRSLSI
jgi:pteridine reductase